MQDTIDLVKIYTKEVENQSKLLTPEEEQELLKRLAEGDMKAKKTLIESNLKLVLKVVNTFNIDTNIYLDVVQEANIGLIEAVNFYDKDKATRFSTYAVWRIRKKVVDYLYYQKDIVHIPYLKSKNYQQIEIAKQEFQIKYGRQPNISELSKIMQLAEKDIEKLMQTNQNIIYFDDITDVELEDEFDTEKEFERQESQEVIKKTLRTLTQLEQKVIKLRFGLCNEGVTLSLQQIGKKLNITGERVRQIEEVALKKLRHPSRIINLQNMVRC